MIEEVLSDSRVPRKIEEFETLGVAPMSQIRPGSVWCTDFKLEVLEVSPARPDTPDLRVLQYVRLPACL